MTCYLLEENHPLKSVSKYPGVIKTEPQTQLLLMKILFSAHAYTVSHSHIYLYTDAYARTEQRSQLW